MKKIPIYLFIVVLLAGIVFAANASLNITIQLAPTNTTCNQSTPTCGSWSACASSLQTRTCTLYNSSNVCGNTTTYGQSQGCSMPSSGGGGSSGRRSGSSGTVLNCNELTDCGGWDECHNGHQTRDCGNKTVICGFEYDKSCDMPAVVKNEPPIVSEPAVTPVVESAVCPPTEVVYIENNSSLYQKFDWWANNSAPNTIKRIWNDKWLLAGIIATLVLLLILILKPKTHKPTTIIPPNKTPHQMDPRLEQLHHTIKYLLGRGWNKYKLIEYFKKKHVDDEDLEKVFAAIEGGGP